MGETSQAAPATPGSSRMAVVDIGSNSARMIVVAAGAGGHLEISADARFPLRLVGGSAGARRLGEAAINRVADALCAFLAVAHSADAGVLVAVATAAVREAANRDEFVRRIASKTGVELEVLEGDAEARYACIGAVHGLPVNSGLVVDVGGGSVEVCQFRDRRTLRQWTLPLGAVRLSDRFLHSDPPRGSEVSRLREEVQLTVAEAGVPLLRPGEQLVGTGGTLRNLAKMDRARRTYPISRLHGYHLSREGVDLSVDRLTRLPLSRRKRVSGLTQDRADSIVGGALCVQGLLSALMGDEMVLSGRGLREGIALERLGLEMGSAGEARRASVAALALRFSTYDPVRAQLRVALAAALLDGVDAEASAEMKELLDHAALLVDIGRSVDYYSRWEHAATMVASSDLDGFGHREIVLLSAVLEKAGEDRVTMRGYRALLSAPDRYQLDRLSVILTLADELSHRLLPDPRLRVQVRRGVVILTLPHDVGKLKGETEMRFQRCFKKRLLTEVNRS